MTVLRRAGQVALVLLATLGILSGIAWAAHAAGLIKPLVVVSGSMSPEIPTGSLVISRPTPITTIEVGDVITVPNPQTGALVTHRVVTIDHAPTGDWTVTLRGDANDGPDPRAYTVASGAEVPSPWFVVPGAGRLVETISRPGVAVPFLIGLVALVALANLPARLDEDDRDDGDDEDDEDHDHEARDVVPARTDGNGATR